MKTLKRMLAVMLAVVMMMGLGVTSMAATPSADGEIILERQQLGCYMMEM